MSLNKKIMIVEDNSTLSDMYKFKFELEGFNVLVCNNGISAVKNVETYKPDILLVDIMMPEMNGYEFIERARSQKLIPEWAKIIVLSNLNEPKDKEMALSLWADEFILKSSYTPKELVVKIKEYFQ